MTPRLGPRTLAIWRLIARHVARTGISPSFREIMEAVRLKSLGNVQWHMARLRKAGLIRDIPGHARSIEVVVWPEPEVFIAVQEAGADMRLVRA